MDRAVSTPSLTRKEFRSLACLRRLGLRLRLRLGLGLRLRLGLCVGRPEPIRRLRMMCSDGIVWIRV